MNATRKMAIGTWRHAGGNPQAAMAVDADLERLRTFLAERAAAGDPITYTHVFAAIAGRAMRRYPELRSVLRRGQLYPRKEVSALVQVALGRDRLTGYVLHNIDRMSPTQIRVELDTAVAQMRSGDGGDRFATVSALLNLLPAPLVGRALDAAGWLFYGANINPGIFGLPQDPFGTIQVNNLGGLGMDDVRGPYVPWMRSVGVVALTRTHEAPVRAADGGVAWRTRMKVWVIVDHRLMDGFLAREIRPFVESYLENPERLWSAP